MGAPPAGAATASTAGSSAAGCGRCGLAALGAPAPSPLFCPPPPAAWLDLSAAQVASLRAHLQAQLADPRSARGIRHDHATAVTIAAAALLPGHRGPAAIAGYAGRLGQATGLMAGLIYLPRTTRLAIAPLAEVAGADMLQFAYTRLEKAASLRPVLGACEQGGRVEQGQV